MAGNPLHICEKRKAILANEGHQLVLGGPGSGKTTIALVKAGEHIKKNGLHAGQHILFLSFARATVARVAQQARGYISADAHSLLEINTYHGFTWALLRSHGYLTHGRNPLQLLPPPEAAARNAGIDDSDRRSNLRSILSSERLLGFDLFAELAGDLLEGSSRLRALISDCYPIIIVDEFQDTDVFEWRMIKALGERSRIIALADPEQRIYQFRGADPARIGEFMKAFNPHVSDFGNENNRSNGTDIVAFGNDLLTGANVGATYSDVGIERYGRSNNELSKLKFAVLTARKRLIASGRNDWSLAVLLGAKELMLRASLFLGSQTGVTPPVRHDVLIDPEGPTLAAILIASLLEPTASSQQMAETLLADVISYIRGHRGGKISQGDLKLATALEQHSRGAKLRGITRKQLVQELENIVQSRFALTLGGDPEADWVAVRDLIEAASHDVFVGISKDAKYVRLLQKGTQLREALAEVWRRSGEYAAARSIVSNAFQQEHFSASTRVWSGVNLMTIHKSKGKEFDEVIIFEGEHVGRLVRDNADDSQLEQSRLTLRVGVTRARQKTLVMTPAWKSCRLL